MNYFQAELNSGHVMQVDEVDWEKISSRNWQATINSAGQVYAKTSLTGKVRVYAHRWILDAPKGMCVDHIDGNTLNNRRSNLRLATYSQNQFNRKKRKNNRSSYKGVTWRGDMGKWVAQICINRSQRYLGTFRTQEEAAAAYRNAAEAAHGEFANFERTA